jgi:hypothetical protein
VGTPAITPGRVLVPLLLAVTLTIATTAVAQAAGPQIAAAWTTEVAATSAKLHAEIDPNGTATTYHFDYITQAAYEKNIEAGHEGFAGAFKAPAGSDPTIPAGTAYVPVYQSIGALSPTTAYRYRVVATNGATTLGEPFAFATESLGGASLLLDERGWEMVSPIEKNGGAIQGPGGNFGGDVLQASADGEAVTYSSSASFGEGAEGAPPASQYISRRSQAGWSTQNITTPILAGSYGDHPDGVPYQLFSPDLARGLLQNGAHCRAENEGCAVSNPPLVGTEAPAGYEDYYLRDDVGASFQALLTQANATLALSPEHFELRFAGASPDLAHVVLSTCAALTPEATEVPGGGGGCEAAATNLYEWGEGILRLVNLLPSESHGTPGAKLAAQGGAISSDGRRVYFTESEDGALYLREAGGPTKLVPESGGGGANFQTASAEGSLAFFTKGGELFRYDAETETSEQLATEVQGVLGASADGSRVYYLTSAGLFLWQAPGTTTEIAPGAPAAFAGDYPPTTGTTRVSADGTRLLFLSEARLTGYDNTDQRTGQPDSEAFLYTAPSGTGEGSLTCLSCNPTNERPLGPSTIPGAIPNGAQEGAADSYKPRDLSADGRRIFFDSRDSLVLQDTNNAAAVYEWEAQGAGTCGKPGGCIGLISSGRSTEGASFVDASADGRDAFFLTDGSLVPADPGSVDLYDARVGGGFPQPPTPIACEGDACQSLPPDPEDPNPGTLLPGPGNPPLSFPKPPRCRKGFVRKHGHCVRKPHHKGRHHKRGHR